MYWRRRTYASRHGRNTSFNRCSFPLLHVTLTLSIVLKLLVRIRDDGPALVVRLEGSASSIPEKFVLLFTSCNSYIPDMSAWLSTLVGDLNSWTGDCEGVYQGL